jgi:hypothetical protein
MRCRQAKKLLFDYIDGVISESDRVGLESHLAECRGCEHAASALSRSLELLHRLPSESPSENFNWKLRLRLAKARRAWRDTAESERAWHRMWNTRFAVAAVSTFVAILVGGGALLVSNGWRLEGGDRFAHMPKPSPGNGTVATGSRGEVSSRAYSPFFSGPSTGIVSRPVATESPLGWDSTGPARPSGPLIDVDSLMVRYTRSRLESQRIRSLEQQIEVLYDELKKCERGQGE